MLMKTKQTVRNCPVNFAFQCSKLWDDLSVTTVPTIRHCSRCDSDVFLCMTDEETIAHAKAGHCIAREEPHESQMPRLAMGRPSESLARTPRQREAERRATREMGIDDAIRNAARAVRECPECHYPTLYSGPRKLDHPASYT